MGAPTTGGGKLLENQLPGVMQNGIQSNKAVNFSGMQVDTSGNITTSGSITASGATQNFAGLTEYTGATGATAVLGTAGAAAGGPTTGQQDGWIKVQIAGTNVWIPVWK